MCSAGRMTPPFPSPPMTAPSSRMVRATLASPTGARRNRAPCARAPHPQPRGWSRGSRPRSAILPHRCAVPAPPGRRRRGCSPRRSACPRSSTSASRSTSGSTAMPMSAPTPGPAGESSPRFSGTGSGARGKRPSVSRLIAGHPTAQAPRAAAGWRCRPRRARSRAPRESGAARIALDVDHREARGPGRGAARRASRSAAHRARPCPSPPAAGPLPPARAPRRRPRHRGRCRPGPTNLSAFHSIGLWLAVSISPAPA